MRILLLGASGYVGGGLAVHLAERHEMVGTRGRRPVPGLIPIDLRDRPALATLAADGFDLIIHAAGVVDLTTAQDDPRTAWEVNVEPMRGLVEAVPPHTRILMLSSDNVFDGTLPTYTEGARPTPINTYGRTKAAAEEILLQEPRHLVLRIPLVFGRSPWSDRFLERFRGPVTQARTDLVCAPVYLPGLAADLERLWHHTGLLHYGGTDVVTRYELMKRVQSALNLDTRIDPVTTTDQPDAVRRPARLVLRSVRHQLAGPDLTTALRDLAGR